MGGNSKNSKKVQSFGDKSVPKAQRVSGRRTKGQPAPYLAENYEGVPSYGRGPQTQSTPMPIPISKNIYRFPDDESVISDDETNQHVSRAEQSSMSIMQETIKPREDPKSNDVAIMFNQLMQKMSTMSTKVTETVTEQNRELKSQLKAVEERLSTQEARINQFQTVQVSSAMPTSNIVNAKPIDLNLGAIPKVKVMNPMPSSKPEEEVYQSPIKTVPVENYSDSIQQFAPNEPLINPEVRRKLHDLPVFTGAPEEWPMFMTTFIETTNAYRYSQLENLIRLQKSIQGKAKEVVESMLVFPSNVPHVMEELQFRFGRPEVLIKSQMDKIRRMPKISDDNYTQLIEFSTKVRNFVAFMIGANAGYHLQNPQLLNELVAKLPNNRRLDWAYAWNQNNCGTSIVVFSDWLYNVAKVASLINDDSTSRTNNDFRKNQPRKYTFHTSGQENNNEIVVKCLYCSKNHKIAECNSFKGLSVSDRWNFVRSKNACFRCLNVGHQVHNCRSKKNCGEESCQRSHHKLLHESMPKKEQKHETSDQENQSDNSNESQSGTVLNVHQIEEEVFFKVIPVVVFGPNQEKVNTFAILDDASSMSFMESSLAKQLNLSTDDKKVVEMSWLNNTVSKRKTVAVDCKIKGRYTSQIYDLKKTYLMDDLSLPSQSMNIDVLKNQYPQLKGLPLKSLINAKPRILIGLNNARLGYVQNYVDCPPSGPMAIETPLGWILYGPNFDQTKQQQPKHVLFIHEALREDYNDLHKTVMNYYELENFGVTKPEKIAESDEVIRARDLLRKTTRQMNNYYEAGLLWKEDETQMPNNYNSTVKRLENLEKKMTKDPVYATKYHKSMQEFIEKGYARQLSKEEVNEVSPNTWYLPHFGVVNPNKPGKLRIVFDAAATTSKISLNSQLLKGPDLNQPMLNVLSQLREAEIAVVADIKEMFLQVKIRKKDQNAQRFLMKENGKIQTFVMESLIFGATCSPTVAQYVKNMNAERYRTTNPDAVQAIIENHYVDDFVKSFQDEASAVRISQDVVKIHQEAGFELRNFVSNSKEVMKILNSSADQAVSLKNLNMEAGLTEKVLGMVWNHESDSFVFDLKFHKVNQAILKQERSPTKREMLSLAMSIFDPFGLLSNFHINPKVIIQKLWSLPIDWDDQVPEQIAKMWYQWQSELPKLKDFKVPRCYSVELPQAVEIQLHLFVDASQEAYAAVSYWRIKTSAKVHVAFIFGKTRVAPRKLLSIPRLELQAAVLGVRMKESVINAHSIKPSKIFYWTDSATVKHWIDTGSHNYKPFVAHRLAEILENSSSQEWSWVPTDLNSADEATRAKFPVQYEVTSKWLQGPEFLKQEESCWPKHQKALDCEVPEEIRRISHVLLVSENCDKVSPEFSRFSKYLRLVRSMAWVFRFIFNLKANKHEKRTGELTASEILVAENHLCKVVQQTTFIEEYSCLKEGEPVVPSSQLYNLSPFLYDDELIRVNGRIKAATEVPLCTKLPIILPKDHYFTHLLVARYHEQCNHQFQETVVAKLREKFWIPSVRVVVKKTKSKCQVCKNKNVKPQQPLMGQLPLDRVAGLVRPFTYTGIDYFGPYNIVIGRSVVKRWVALFVCSTYRAVHLEVAHDLSTDACILCLRNFFNLRGVPKRMRSDNGTNFVGLKGELCNVNDFLDHDKVRTELAPFGIEWLFNAPGDPSAGGSWERMVQSIKRALGSTMEKRSLQEHTFRSLLYEAMNIVNSCPLTHIPVSPEDLEPLTPNHFLIGETNSTQIPGQCSEKIMCIRKQWVISQQLKNHFYSRWLQEYLPVLTRRCKWFKDVPPLRQDQLVVICDTDLPRSKWPMGKIVEVIKANDGQVRTVKVRTETGVFRRPAHKIAVLDVEVNPGEGPRGRECQRPLEQI